MHPPRFLLPLLAAALLTAGLAAPAAQAAPPKPTAPADVHRDVFPGSTDRKAGPAVRGPRIGARGLAGPLAVPNSGFTCDGTDGPRVEVLYVREPDMPDRLTELMPALQAWLINADAAFNDGAARTGDSRHIRYLTEMVGGTCQAVVRNVTVPDGSLPDWTTARKAVIAAGHDKPQRKYLMITEDKHWCGAGEKYDDDRPGPENINNTLLGFARVDAIEGCLGANAIAHELMHAIGAVQLSAPHNDYVSPKEGGSHCTQRFDMMCYAPQSTFDCPEWDAERLPDCGSDDYFDTDPAAGSYLATHWNTANSIFLRAGSTPDNQTYPRPGRAYTIRSKVTGEALDIEGGAPAAPLAHLGTAPATGAAGQQWLVSYKTGIQLMNRGSLLCADAAQSGKAPGTRALQYTCNGQDGMRWAYLPHADGTFSVLNWLNGLALTQAGSSVAHQVYTGADDQRWSFTALPDAGVQSDSQYTVTGFGNRLPVGTQGTVEWGSPARTVGDAQPWRLQAVGAHWQLVHVPSGRCVDNAWNSAADAPLVLTGCGEWSTGQLWSLRRVADGAVMLVNRHSNLAMTTTGDHGAPLQQRKLNIDTGSQVFFLDRA